MKCFRLLIPCLILVLPNFLIGQSICTNSGISNDNPRCNEITATYFNGYCQSGHCRFDFGTTPSGYTLISRTASQATYYIGQGAGNYRTLFISSYDSVLNCQGHMDWTDRFAYWTYPDITGSIPACPNIGQTYTYIAHRWSNGNPYALESLSWAIQGGTITSTTYSPPNVPPYAYDTVRVQWNAAGPHRLICSRTGTASGGYGPWFCINRDTLWNGNGPPPTIQGPSALCGGTTTGTFQASNFDPAFAYVWTCSNGTIASGQGTGTVTVNWAGSGTLTLTRTASPCGWTDVATKNVTISGTAGPVPNLGPDQTPCMNSQVLLTPGSGFSTYRWNNLWVTPVMQPTTSGLYAVTVTNALGCMAADTVIVNFTGTLTPPAFPYSQTVCTGAALYAGTYTSYLWNTGATTASIVPPANGQYSVTVSNGGCTTSAVTHVTLGPSLNPNLGPDQAVCPGTSVVLNPGTFSTYSWSTGATTQTISPTTSGTYAVTVSNGTCTDSDTITLTILPSPQPNLGPDQSACSGTSVVLNPGNFASYLWSTGATTQTIAPTTSGTFTVTVTAANGCTGSDAVNVTFYSPPNPNLGPDQTICGTSPVTLNPGNFTSYAWSNGAITQTISASATGDYAVTVTSLGGCTASDTVSLTFLPLPTFSLGNDSFLCADTAVILSGPLGMSSYAWSNGGSSSNITVASGGSYSLTVTDANGCTSADAIVLQGLTDCVFPGDANYDGVADNLDVLNIGAYYGLSNFSRANPSSLWYGQNTNNWGGALPGNADPKHSDCDGDGSVIALDTSVVHLNYGRTHTKANGLSTAGSALRIVALQDSIAPGALAWFAIELGDAQNLADSVYGLAFDVVYGGTAVGAGGMNSMDFSNCWFATTGARLQFIENRFPLPSVTTAVVRNDQAEQLGHGEVCRFAITTDSNMVPVRDIVWASLGNVTMVNALLAPQAVTPIGDSLIVSQLVTGVGGSTWIAAPSLFPNPATDQVTVAQAGASLISVTAMDATGRVVFAAMDLESPELTFSTAPLAQGAYFVRIESTAGTYSKKLFIAR